MEAMIRVYKVGQIEEQPPSEYLNGAAAIVRALSSLAKNGKQEDPGEAPNWHWIATVFGSAFSHS